MEENNNSNDIDNVIVQKEIDNGDDFDNEPQKDFKRLEKQMDERVEEENVEYIPPTPFP